MKLLVIFLLAVTASPFALAQGLDNIVQRIQLLDKTSGLSQDEIKKNHDKVKDLKKQFLKNFDCQLDWVKKPDVIGTDDIMTKTFPGEKNPAASTLDRNDVNHGVVVAQADGVCRNQWRQEWNSFSFDNQDDADNFIIKDFIDPEQILEGPVAVTLPEQVLDGKFPVAFPYKMTGHRYRVKTLEHYKGKEFRLVNDVTIGFDHATKTLVAISRFDHIEHDPNVDIGDVKHLRKWLGVSVIQKTEENGAPVLKVNSRWSMWAQCPGNGTIVGFMIRHGAGDFEDEFQGWRTDMMIELLKHGFSR